MYVNVFRFCTSTFLTDDACEHVNMQKWNNSLRLYETSGLSLHCFERTVGFLTQITIKTCYSAELELLSWNGKQFVLDDYLFFVHFPVSAICVIEDKVGK